MLPCAAGPISTLPSGLLNVSVAHKCRIDVGGIWPSNSRK